MADITNPFSRRAWVLTWLWTAALGTLFLVAAFGLYGIVERRWLIARLTLDELFWLHAIRGVGASICIGTWTFFNVWRMRRRYDAAFRDAYRRLQQDMEQRTRAAAELEAQVRNQERLAALGVLASGIAHDIANPLASMSSELEMLESEVDPARIRDSLGVARVHIGRISRALRDMTDFARRRGEDSGLVAIPAAVEDALRMVRHDLRARRVRVAVELDPSLPPVRIVEDHLVMVLVNLFLNAFDAMPDGGTLTIRSERTASGLQLSVRDTGCGMDEEVRRRAMEPLFTTKPGGRGTGLGLSVSADVLRGAGGSLELDSAPGAGTTVRLRLPITAEKEPCLSAS